MAVIMAASFVSSAAMAGDATDVTVQDAIIAHDSILNQGAVIDQDAFFFSFRRTPTNPNQDEWNLINLTSTIVSSASGGSGVKVALLDGRTDCRDTDLKGRCFNYTVPGGRYRKYDSHGTHTAGIIAGSKYGVATSATILNYAVFDDNGWVATGSKLVDVWRSAYSAGARIASMSFGCQNTALCFSASEVAAMADSSQPMLYVKAAGNDGIALPDEAISVDYSTATAALNRLILVGSVNVNGTISSFSNQPGEGCLIYSGASGCSGDTQWKYHFLVAPGESIYSTLPNNTYGYMSGTSMATPVVAGVAALLQKRWPALTPEATAEILLTTATDQGAPGVDPVYGYGLLNATAAFQANGTVTLASSGGSTTTVSNSWTFGSPFLSKFASSLDGVTVYDSFGRDFALGETGALQQSYSALAMRQLLGRRLLGASAMEDWTDSFFADAPEARGFALYGSPADSAGSMLALDLTSRMGVDMPFKGGMAQFRLTGAGDARMDFAYDPTMRPLAYFPSTGLLKGALISNALIKMPGRSRLMVYGVATTGALEPGYIYNPMEMRLTDRGYMPRIALSKDPTQSRQQTGFGAGYWMQPDRKTVVGVNASAIVQKGGYYSLTSDLADFERPTRMYNLGAAAARRMGDWELSLSGELTHLQMQAGQGTISFTPANLVSAEIGVRKAKLFAGHGSGLRDSLAVSLAMPPRAVSGNLRVDYMTRTADGLGRQAASLAVPLSRLGQEPVRAELAYRLAKGSAWSFNLSGGVNLADTQVMGTGEVMASLKLAL